MSLRHLPEIRAENMPQGIDFQPPTHALERWQPELMAADSNTDNNTISILDFIGEDDVGGGVSAKRVAAALRTIGKGDVNVDINSPGGSFFQGAAIYNLLREHPGKVTVRVLGLAASAASVIAMAGDEIQMSNASFMMIHNSWVLTIGDRNGLRAAADYLAPFDSAMAAVYEERTGNDVQQIESWMDKETWFNGQQAIEAGFADAPLPADAVSDDNPLSEELRQVSALRRIDTILARQGMPRSERRALVSELKGGTPGAASTITPSADLVAAVERLSQTL